MIDVDDVDNPFGFGDAVADAIFASSCSKVSLEGFAQGGAKAVRVVAQRSDDEFDASGRD